jgi:hypothetical protein
VNQKVAKCPICQISKTEHVHYLGLLEPLQVPHRRWADISLDFIERLPKSRGKDVILVVLGRLTKYAHFCPLAHPFLYQPSVKTLHG